MFPFDCDDWPDRLGRLMWLVLLGRLWRHSKWNLHSKLNLTCPWTNLSRVRLSPTDENTALPTTNHRGKRNSIKQSKDDNHLKRIQPQQPPPTEGTWHINLAMKGYWDNNHLYWMEWGQVSPPDHNQSGARTNTHFYRRRRWPSPRTKGSEDNFSKLNLIDLRPNFWIHVEPKRPIER